jgi:NAD(P)-dependent dehydrogenase (short-subunit alcohol dehydrogenase family)
MECVMLLEDKVVVVSGIGPGLGIHLATLAAQEGASVVVAARTVSKLDGAERAIRSLGLETRILKVPTDIAKPGDCSNLAEQVIRQFGRIDALVNSAYVPGTFGTVESANLDDWRATFEVNLFGSLNLVQAVLPHMKHQRRGAIVNVNSQVVRKPLAGQGGYAASKAALACATSYLALECGKYGIRVNSVFLGWMWGPAVAGYFEGMAGELKTTVEALKENVAEGIALGFMPEDRDCAKSVLYLISDYASVVTGASLDVNGGEYFPT